MHRNMRIQYLVGIAASVLLLLMSVQKLIPIELSLLETVAAITSAWSVWLLAKNNLSGWWIGLIGVALYAVIFYQVRLYAEVGLQIFYFVTSLQAIYIWLRGGQNQTEKPVGRVSQKWLIVSAALAIISVFTLQAVLMAIRGAVPFWDALTAVMSLVAHLYLMGRYVESWYLWIVVDIIYVPLYASRRLYLTSILYGIFGLMAINGLLNFQRIYQKNSCLTETSKLS